MKRLLFFLFLGLASATTQAGTDSLAVVSRDMKVDSILQKAASYLGVSYCRGGVTRNCFDCSGYVQKVFAAYGVDLPHSSAAMAHQGKHIKKKEDLRPGDLILFKGRNAKSRRIGHVGIVVQNDGFGVIFIHASVNRGICFEELQTSSYYNPRFMGGRRVIPEVK